MEEAERVLDRLRRIELLDREEAPAGVLLAELRELVAEAEAWARVESPGNPAVDALRRAVDTGEETARANERTLVA